MTEMCRTCLSETCNTDYINIFCKLNEDITLLDCITDFFSIQILDEDPLPQSICNECYIKLQAFYTFREVIVTSDKQLKDKLRKIPETFIKNTFQNIVLNKNSDKSIEDIYYNNSIESNILENEDTQSLKSEDNMKTDLESSPFNNTLNLSYVNINNNPPECQDHLRIKRTDKQSNTKGKLKAKVKKSNILKIHECKECQKVFKKADHLNVHISYKHSEKQFKCEICGKKFARKYDLAYHSRVHTGERPFTCEMCGKSFASSSYFYMHKRIHTGIKKLKCEFCQHTFNNADQLRIHIRQKHTGERPFLCEMCSHAFTSSSALFRHKRDVHDEKVECPICNKLYSSRVLKDHIKRHNERDEGIKRFSCDLCGKRFTCATSRKRHLVVHSGEKAFKCEVCEKSFNQRSTLQTHMRIHSQVMPFHCEICSKSFRYKHHLKIHSEKHHKDENCNLGDTPNFANIFIKAE